MSHYTVAVIHKENQNIDDLLAPYDENMSVEPYVELSRQDAIDRARKLYNLRPNDTDDDAWKVMAKGYTADMVDDDGNLYTTYNPNSKWDWYEIGGRWSLLLKKNNGERCDSGKIRDLDFSLDMEKYRKSLRFWDVYVEKKPVKRDENESDFQSLYKEQYYIDRYGTREVFAKSQASFITYAVVTPDGVWHSPGDMGWFGASTESDDEWRKWNAEYMDRFVNNQDPDYIITVVDCHI